MSSEKPDQIQASVAAALSRLRGDLGPSGATAPKADTPQGEPPREMARPANDVRGDPFFRSIQAPPAAASGASRGPIPMTPFARMQAPQEPIPPESASPETPEEPAEPTTMIEIPPMPTRLQTPEPVTMPEPTLASSVPPQPPAAPTLAPQPAAPAAATPQPITVPPGGVNSPLSRMMRGTAADPAKKDPAQRDLLANLPPPPISEPISGDTESSAMRRRRRNRRLLAIAGVIIIAAIGAWLWTGKEKSTEIPVIAADSTPEKVKPADEGGLQVPNQNVQVLENMAGQPAQQQGETVMPEPEQPVTPPAATSEQAPGTGQAPTVVENTAPDSDTTSQAPAVDTPPAPEAPLSNAPLPEQNENATADATASTPPSPESTAPAPQPTQTAETPATTEQAPATAEQAPAQSTAQPAPTQPEPVQTPKAQPTTTQEAAVTPTAPAGNTRVQLAAGKSEDSVKKEWAALQKAHPDLLGSLTLSIEKVDKGAAGIFYRLQAGPLADKAAAKKLCASLKQAHQDCIVVMK